MFAELFIPRFDHSTLATEQEAPDLSGKEKQLDEHQNTGTGETMGGTLPSGVARVDDHNGAHGLPLRLRLQQSSRCDQLLVSRHSKPSSMVA